MSAASSFHFPRAKHGLVAFVTVSLGIGPAAMPADAPHEGSGRVASNFFKGWWPSLPHVFLGDEEGEVTVSPGVPLQSPARFNPDPGGGPSSEAVAATAASGASEQNLLFGATPIAPAQYGSEAVPLSLRLPRADVRGHTPIRKLWEPSTYPLGRQGLGFPKGFTGVPNRWFLNIPRWQRYMDPSNETPYMKDTARLWHPYEQSTLKGDVPIIGEDIFMNVTAKNFTLLEKRKLPTPSGVSAATANSSEFFGRSEQFLVNNDTSLAVDIFEGETAFKPVTWLVRVLGVYNNNWFQVKENNAIDPDPRGTGFDDDQRAPNGSRIQAVPENGTDFNPKPGVPGKFTKPVNPGDVFNFLQPELNSVGDARDPVPVNPNTNEIPQQGTDRNKRREHKDRNKDFSNTRYTNRHRDFFALQEAFAEIHIGDLSDNYDFLSSRWGMQPFNSDFRGFIFSDTNLGARLFGNWNNNLWQYNLAYFNQREKDTYSDLNTLDSRHQQVLIANVFRQDLIWKGYTSQLSFHMNIDDGGTHYDKNGFLTRPQLLGTVPDSGDTDSNSQVDGHDVKAFYFGWTGDGHIGRFNITHAFYQVFGEDEYNGLAGRKVDINAQMAAIELSYDRDWIRYKLSGFYASGDSDPTDRTAKGFDTILDNPFFIGGPFSWYVHQGFNLAGTSVNLKQRDSLVPNLRTSKTEGQSNFVNPGVFIVGVGTDIDVTPKLKAFANVNYIWLAETKPIEIALQTNKSDNDLGLDTSFGFRYRPLLTENIILSSGLGVFFPGEGYRDIYRRNTAYVPGYGSQDQAGKVDRYLYNAFMTLTFIY